MKPLHYKKHTLAKRFLSLLCVLALCLGLLPVTALAAGEHDSHSNGWTEFTAGTTTLSGGSYYLSGDVEYSGTESITVSGEVILCLNDHKLDLKGQHISVGSGASLTLCDCSTGGVLTGGSGSNGGGVYVGGGGTFTMTGGSIAGNTANAGGGVYVDEGGTFTMEDGSINNNQATSGGGGGVMVNKGSLTLSGGSITGNTTNSDTFGYGGGVCLYGTFYLSGDSIIQNNTKAGATDNLYLGWNTIKITGPLGENARIGVTAEGVPRSFISGWSDNMAGENPADYFSSDGDAWDIGLNANGDVVLGSLCTIVTQPADKSVIEGKTATFTVNATGSEPLSYQWQQNMNGSGWTDITGETNATYTTEKTTMDMNGTQYRCVVSNSAGSVISDAATLTVNAVTTYTINATANPAEGGTVTVNGGETSATVTEGSEATLTATVNEGWRFAGWMENGQLVSNETTYTITANGNRTLTAEFEKVYKVTVNSTAGGTATADKTTAAEGETVTLTATPNSGYHFAGWNVVSGTVTIQDKQFIMPANDVDIQAIFARNTSPTIPPTVSEKTIDAIADAEPGETVTVDLSSGSTKLDKEVFETLAGKDVTLVVDLGDDVSWTVNGSDIPEDADFTDIDMGVTMNSDGIPVDIINAITGEHGSVQVELAHNGAFGFTMTLTAPLGAENAGYWANLYHFKVNDGEAGREGPLGDNEEAGEMTFETAAPIGDDGSVSLPLSHASQYAIVIDDHNHGVVTLPFTDVSEGDWFYDPVCFVYSQGLMTGTSATTFEPNTSLSRAMLVAVLHRLEDSPQASAGDFTDVADGDWYAQAVNWAASVGVVNGFDDGNFSPNAAITREQLAAILMNYAQYKGQDVSARATLDTYNDATAISSWANDVMSWAVAEGLLTGVTNDQLQPQGNATRAQVAAILQRFLSE